MLGRSADLASRAAGAAAERVAKVTVRRERRERTPDSADGVVVRARRCRRDVRREGLVHGKRRVGGVGGALPALLPVMTVELARRCSGRTVLRISVAVFGNLVLISRCRARSRWRLRDGVLSRHVFRGRWRGSLPEPRPVESPRRSCKRCRTLESVLPVYARVRFCGPKSAISSRCLLRRAAPQTRRPAIVL